MYDLRSKISDFSAHNTWRPVCSGIGLNNQSGMRGVAKKLVSVFIEPRRTRRFAKDWIFLPQMTQRKQRLRDFTTQNDHRKEPQRGDMVVAHGFNRGIE